MELEKNTFNIEKEASCSYDYLEIFDGPTLDSPPMGKMCGKGTNNADWTDYPVGFPSLMTSTSNAIYLRFRSDGSVQEQGWKLRYRAVNRPSISSTGSNDISKKSIWLGWVHSGRYSATSCVHTYHNTS